MIGQRLTVFHVTVAEARDGLAAAIDCQCPDDHRIVTLATMSATNAEGVGGVMVTMVTEPAT